MSRLLLALFASAAPACNGKLSMRYGEELCDAEHACPAGYACEQSLCVPASPADPSGGDAADPDVFVGDWDNPLGDATGDFDNTGFCRVDAQCPLGQACIEARCRVEPCAEVTCGGGEVCSYRCLPTASACLGKTCAENLEYCIDGVCLPTCIVDSCLDPGCDEATDDFCLNRSCINGTICVGGRCVPVFPCDNDFCPAGFVCSVDCAERDPCDPNPCNPGWSCRVEGDSARCVENDCSGLSCGDGELCISGDCIDPCAAVACERGGRLCPQLNQVCCERTCCEAGLLCRGGRCLPPEGVCDPPCAAGQLCVQGVCLCDEPTPLLCASNECCVSAACEDPCEPNPCAHNPVDRICIRDCGLAEGFRCNDGCDGVVCALPNTTCDADDGGCKCGPTEQICQGGQCCVADNCQDPCATSPCAANPQNRHCVVDCTTPVGYTCTDYCSGISCTLPFTACDPADGICKCGGVACGPGQCCVAGACADPCAQSPCGTQECVRDCAEATGYSCVDRCVGNACVTSTAERNPDCRSRDGQAQCYCEQASAQCAASQCCTESGCVDPCASNPCGALECVRDCTQPGDFFCRDNCGAGACSTNAQNPNCNPQTASCGCLNLAGTLYNVCGAGTCCNSSLCEQVCGTNNATNPCQSAPSFKCTVACQFTGPDYTCSDPCSANTCATASGGRNPQCRANPSNQNNAQCFCAVSAAVCASGTCCGATGCENPCQNPGNPCLVPTSKCAVACSTTVNDYTCSDPCLAQPCAQPTPSCAQNADGTRSCSCGGASCGAPNCCVGNACVDPCAGNPCGAQECVRDCAQASGYSCRDNCAPSPCTDPKNPTCNPLNGACSCAGVTCSGATSCCVGGACVDPCAASPCGTLACVRDCARATGYSCVDYCSGYTCPAQNPTCDPSDASTATRCSCGADTCAGSECCVGGACVDACAASPCSGNPTNKKCVQDCGRAEGYRCESFCTGVNCGAPLTCDPADGVCGCGASYGDCDPSGTPGATQICCSVSGSLQCVAPACSPGGCGFCTGDPPTPILCDPCTGCVGCSG